MDALIVGAGVIGLAIARELAGRGMQVMVLDRGDPGKGASGAAAGMLATQAECREPGPLLDLGLASRDLYPGWVEAIKENSGLDPEYDTAGTLAVACSTADEAFLDEQKEWQTQRGLPHRLLSRRDLRSTYPELTEMATSGLFFPLDHRLDPRRLCQALAAAVRGAGIPVETGAEVTGFMHEAGRVKGILLGERELRAPVVIAAAGAWTGLLPQIAGMSWPEVPPIRGQMIVLETRDGLPLSSAPHFSETYPAVVSSRGYLVPRRSGHVLFGSTMEDAGYDASPTVAGVEDLKSRAGWLFPDLAGARLESTWAGLRPGSPDGLPTIGEWMNTGAILATGHHRNGILLAPITAQLVADLVEGLEPQTSLAPFRPERWQHAAWNSEAGSRETPGP